MVHQMVSFSFFQLFFAFMSNVFDTLLINSKQSIEKRKGNELMYHKSRFKGGADFSKHSYCLPQVVNMKYMFKTSVI